MHRPDPIAALFAKRDAAAREAKPAREFMYLDGQLVTQDAETVAFGRDENGAPKYVRTELVVRYLENVANARAR
jgi:hypothetical protein